ncbi:MAG: hypothetical protein MJA29_00285 [Candidatus Omnitrophica bacterium]|nr:hypothetical protein [Candidatus Omnitrophota bacterium]
MAEEKDRKITEEQYQMLVKSFKVCIIASMVTDMRRSEPEFDVALNELGYAVKEWRLGLYGAAEGVIDAIVDEGLESLNEEVAGE